MVLPAIFTIPKKKKRKEEVGFAVECKNLETFKTHLKAKRTLLNEMISANENSIKYSEEIIKEYAKKMGVIDEILVKLS